MKNVVNIGKIKIGGSHPVAVQSMTNVPTGDFDKLFAQINELKNADCDIVRIAVTGNSDIQVCKKILNVIDIPLVADIQFDYRLAIQCSDIGFHKVRFNPGNIGSQSKVGELVAACKTNGTPIRIGVNGGSLEKEILDTLGDTPQALVESALRHVRILEQFGFYNTVISVKSSDVRKNIEAYELLNAKCDYPLHIGVTESGSAMSGLIKSAIGIGSLLLKGIGNTVRVSLTGNPIKEVDAAKSILRSLKLENDFIEIISCPTCARCSLNLEKITNELTEFSKGIKKQAKVAVMGCVVNGPGEARDADFGIAGGAGKAVLFKKGEIIGQLNEDEILPTLKRMIMELKDDKIIRKTK